MVEWIAQLAHEFEIHLYSQSVEDLEDARIIWHRIPRLPGPHLTNYLWWFLSNHIYRTWNRFVHRTPHDLIFSPGINCADADAISVHIVFAEYCEKNRSRLRLTRNSVHNWPRILHRKLYYSLLKSLERRFYTRNDTTLILIAKRTAAALGRFYCREGPFPIVYGGLDQRVFNPIRRQLMRAEARKMLGISQERFAILLIGNDLTSKGLPVLLNAIDIMRDFPIDLLCVTAERASFFDGSVRERLLNSRVRFLPPRPDVEFYYAAADAYAGPSLEDTFAQPPAEAMASGLPVIVSAANGTSEIITDGVDGLILQDPTDARTLSMMIRRLYEDPEFRRRLGENAARTALQYTWERNGQELGAIFREILHRRSSNAPNKSVRDRA